MKVTVEWLREFVQTDASAQDIGATLTMLGVELEGIEDSPLGEVLDFKVTPNRGDCLSVLGLARELSAKDSQRFKPTELFARLVGPTQSSKELQGDLVKIEDAALCPRYAAGIFNSIKVGASSAKMQSRLNACGMRPINIIVDTTNYVMLELGQPLHAFDMKHLAGERIVVRRAHSGEKMTTLDGVKRDLRDDMLMICDAEKPVAIAGVMGGENSEVADTTTSVLLESAHFDAVSVRRTRKALGMSTEASYRFERYVDPNGAVRAINRFAELLKEQGGPLLVGVCDAYPQPKALEPIAVRERRWNSLLGMDVPKAAAATSLTGLGLTVKEADDGLSATPPSWRNDIVLEEDLVEEIGRLRGYDRIPEALPYGSTPLGGETDSAALRTQVRNALLRLGFTEAVTHTLTDKSPLDPDTKLTQLRNPGAPELAVLRPSLLPGLANVAARNRGTSLALFEVGRVFRNDKESRGVGILLSGRLHPEHWKTTDNDSADFFALKGVVEELASLIRRPINVVASSDKRFHPTRQGAIEGVGIFGEVLPSIAAALDLPAATLMAEIDIDALEAIAAQQPSYQQVSAFPAVRRDLAFVVNKTTPYTELEHAVMNAAGDLAERVWLFDVYEGKGIEAGHHSIGIALLLRHSSRTLTDDEANEVREKAFLALEKFGAKRR